MPSTDEKELFLINEYDPELLDKAPITEKDLMTMYSKHSDNLYLYLQETINPFILPLSNELRAMLGHIATYRVANHDATKRDLDKAYGHFRRFNIDALKILCDEFDRSLSGELKKQYTYDYRDICSDYLDKYSSLYFKAKNLYLNAQMEERVGSDYEVHNLIELYYNAAKEYIQLKRYYQQYKPDVMRIRRHVVLKRVISGFMVAIGIIGSIVGLLP